MSKTMLLRVQATPPLAPAPPTTPARARLQVSLEAPGRCNLGPDLLSSCVTQNRGGTNSMASMPQDTLVPRLRRLFLTRLRRWAVWFMAIWIACTQTRSFWKGNRGDHCFRVTSPEHYQHQGNPSE